MRINKYLAGRLGISRRRADEILQAGRITVDGTLVTVGLDVSDTNTVLIDGRPLPQEKKFEYVLLNKPVGYVCSRDGQGSYTIYDLLPREYNHLNPVGRLDKDSSGLLLLTNDGALHNELTHPSSQKEKVYIVTLNKPLAQADAEQITAGIQLFDGVSALGLRAMDQERRIWEVRMHEGRNRQIRRTFRAVGYIITTLQRMQFGDYKIGTLAPGKYSLITLDELNDCGNHS